MTITWHTAGELNALSAPPPTDQPWCRVLVADLRDARIIPLLSPAPVAGDYKDEARPATNDRAYFLARRAALRSMIGAICNVAGDSVQIAYNDDGAPRVTHPAGLYVSISGHGPYAMLAIASHPCGVDFEPQQDNIEPIHDVLHPQELQHLDAMPAGERSAFFLRIWTAKEAYLKALGRGFLNNPQQVCIEISGEHILVTEKEKRTEQQTGIMHSVSLDRQNLIAACVVLDQG